MNRKDSEKAFSQLLSRYNIWYHKNRDAMYCPRCRNLLWKSEKSIDYHFVIDSTFGMCECKQGETGFAFGDPGAGIRPIQRQIMDDWQYNHHVTSWIFLLLGDGRAPAGKNAYLVPWYYWKAAIEETALSLNVKTLPWKPNQLKYSTDFNAEHSLQQFKLWWKNGGWDFPDPDDYYMHDFQKTYIFLKPFKKMSYIEKEITEDDDSPSTNGTNIRSASATNGDPGVVIQES